MILKDHTSAPIRKERLSPTSKARMEASRNEFVEKGEMPHRVKSFEEIDSSQNRPRARRRECTDLGLDLSEKEEQVVCHASALALAMTDETRREAEM